MKHSHIMLIDDNEGDLFLMNEVLERIEVQEITMLKDGDAVVDYFSKKGNYPELIFLDVNLPKRNGFEVLSFLKGNGFPKYIPIIMFSTSSSIQDVKKSYEGDASVFLTKPEDYNNFEALVTKAVKFWFNYSRLLKTNGIKQL